MQNHQFRWRTDLPSKIKSVRRFLHARIIWSVWGFRNHKLNVLAPGEEIRFTKTIERLREQVLNKKLGIFNNGRWLLRTKSTSLTWIILQILLFLYYYKRYPLNIHVNLVFHVIRVIIFSIKCIQLSSSFFILKTIIICFWTLSDINIHTKKLDLPLFI